MISDIIYNFTSAVGNLEIVAVFVFFIVMELVLFFIDQFKY
jgi:hypothetical protein